MGDEQERAAERLERVLERLARVEVEVVGRLVEDQDVRLRRHQHRQREPPALAARQSRQRLLGLGAREQEAPEQGARPAGREPGGALGGLERGARRAELLRVLREVAELHVVPGAQPARLERAAPGERLDQGRLADAVGADERHVLAALEPELAVLEQRPAGHLEPRVVELEHHAAGALRGGEAEAERAVVARVALDALHLLQALDARLGLARLGRLVAEALDEALHAGDLALLLLDRLAQRDLARRQLAAPGVPGTREEARPARLQLEHRGADRLQEPAVVGDEDDCRVEAVR